LTDPVRPVSASELDEVLRLTAPAVWDGLRDRSVFLTGGTGFVGKWLLECMLHADRALGLGLTLTVLTRDPDHFTRSSPHLARASAVELVTGDMAGFELPGRAFPLVIHAALPVAPPQSAAGTGLEELAVAGARRACEFAAASGAKRFLHVSSGAVYGAQLSSGAFSEDQPWHDDGEANGYTRAKRRAEEVVTQSWPFDVVVARCFAFLGPWLLGSSGAAAAQFVEQAAQGHGITVQGTGKAVRTYQYASDMARWLLSCLVLGAPGRAYNVGGEAEVTIARLAGEVTRLAETGIPVHVAGQAAPGLAGQRYVPDLRRAASELGLVNAVGLEEGIRRTLLWHATRRVTPIFSA
jgi:nucleoside-diphosphate-sugar epimerase